eukprot:gene20141-24759_t
MGIGIYTALKFKCSANNNGGYGRGAVSCLLCLGLPGRQHFASLEDKGKPLRDGYDRRMDPVLSPPSEASAVARAPPGGDGAAGRPIPMPHVAADRARETTGGTVLRTAPRWASLCERLALAPPRAVPPGRSFWEVAEAMAWAAPRAPAFPPLSAFGVRPSRPPPPTGA